MSGTTIKSSGTAALQLAVAAPSPVIVQAGVTIALAGSAAGAALSLSSALYGGPGADWTILNDGTLAADLTLASGVDVGGGLRLAGAGSVTNATGGLIEGNEAGLALLAGGVAVNQGSISGGVGGAGAGLGRIGVQIAGGVLANEGVIQGGAYGVSLGAPGQVQNAGQISGGAAGLVLASGGTLGNQAGGTVYGGVAGVVLQAGASLVNAGGISAPLAGAGHEGVVLGSGAYVGNSGDISGFNGVSGASGTVTLVNDGRIESGGGLTLSFPATGYSFVSGAAVELTSAVVTNEGSILGNDVPDDASMQAGSAGSGLILGAGTLDNRGAIAGGGGAYATHGGVGLAGAAQLGARNSGLIAGGAGTYGGTGALFSGGSLLNSGTILGGAGSVSGGDGVVLTNGAVLVNQGSVEGGAGSQYVWGTGLGAGVVLYGGTLENEGLLTGGGQQFMGLWMGGGQVTNTGTIIGRAAVAMQGGTLENDGLISGTEVAVDLAGGGFLNAGTLAGGYAVYMAGAGASLAVAPGAVFRGKVTDHAGGGTLRLTGSASAALDMGASFSGFSEISFATGAGWMLEGGVAQLAGGEAITGFTQGDALLLEGFTAASEIFAPGTGLVLAQGATSVTLDITGSLSPEAFTISAVAQGTEIVICYRRGTLIETPQGARDVADLRIGDVLPTRFGGLRRIKWIGRQSFGPEEVRGNRARIPVCIHPGALGEGKPRRALYVSPGHSMLLDGVLVLARALVNGVTITQEDDKAGVDYFLPEFETHDCILAEGAWSESFADGPGLRGQFHNRADFCALHPGDREPDEISLCAPRPLQGAALEQALRPVVARAAPDGTPGPLRGCVDVADGRRIEGWAQDMDWPELPQALEVYAGNQKLGEALACHYREDLARAGIGAGRAAFSFIVPQAFNPARLRVRRAIDGAQITPAGSRAAVKV
ncbi:MAG TPA: Hint domain-containing protein [Acidocella sp.]|nr:Hint domain-containing protein [Acidocella sp.]